MKFTCKDCKRNFKVLTKKGFCCYCSYKRTGKYPDEFSDYTKDKQGKLISNVGAMKFRGKSKKK